MPIASFKISNCHLDSGFINKSAIIFLTGQYCRSITNVVIANVNMLCPSIYVIGFLAILIAP